MYALMKDWSVMCRTPTGAVWNSIRDRAVELADIMTWPTREGATAAAEIQGAAVVPINQVRRHAV